jgi:hypothetical protein
VPSTISQVGDGLKARLATITGLRTYSYQPEQLLPPVGYVTLNNISYHGAFQGGNQEMEWSVIIVVGRWTDREANARLDDYATYSGAKSVRAAIEADKTLGGVCDTLIVQSSSAISSLEQADAEFLTIEFTVTVYG